MTDNEIDARCDALEGGSPATPTEARIQALLEKYVDVGADGGFADYGHIMVPLAAELDASYAAQGRLESENITLRVELGKARDALEQLVLAANKWRSLSEDAQIDAEISSEARKRRS